MTISLSGIGPMRGCKSKCLQGKVHSNYDLGMFCVGVRRPELFWSATGHESGQDFVG